MKSDFDDYVAECLKDPDYRRAYAHSGQDLDLVLKLRDLRVAASLSQMELAKRAGTTQQQISRMESPGYHGHSLRLLRQVADALGMDLVVSFRKRTEAKASPKKPRSVARAVASPAVAAKRSVASARKAKSSKGPPKRK